MCAETSISASSEVDALAIQLYSVEIFHEAKRLNFFGRFIGENPNSMIHMKRNLIKEKGDRIQFNLVTKLTGSGRSADSDLEGNEESMTFYNDTVLVDQLRHAIRLAGKMTEQRTKVPLREEAKSELARWWADKFTEWIFKKLSGTTLADGASTTVGEAATANSNIIYGGDAQAANQLDDTDTFTLALLDKAKVVAKTGLQLTTTKWKIRPLMIDGKEYYVSILHPYSIYDLRGTDDWKQAQREANVRGMENPLFSGASGIWNGVIIFEHDQVVLTTTGGAGGDVQYANNLFLGAQAGLLAIAQESPDWVEKTFQYGNEWGVATGMVMGFDKARFNSLDFAVINLRASAVNPLEYA